MTSSQPRPTFSALIDSHCHLDDRTFETDVAGVLQRAAAAGVRYILNAGINRQSSRRCVALSRQYAGLYAAVGFHPHDASNCSEPALKELIDLTQQPEVKAWGEIGLDFNRMFSPRADQEKWFIRQLAIADSLKLPVILHERETDGRLLELLKQHHRSPGNGVVHCFSGSGYELQEYLAMGYRIGITGIITLSGRNQKLAGQVRSIPENRLLIETDAPYLTPWPEKKTSRRNEPAFVASVLNALAIERGQDGLALEHTIFENTQRLFGLKGAALGASAV